MRVYLFASLSLLVFALPLRAESAALADLFAERMQSVVFVEFFIERELDRQPGEAAGLVIGDEGEILLLADALPHWLPPSQLRELKVFPPHHTGEGFAATYLGPDSLNGWHHLKAEEAAWPTLQSILDYPTAPPRIGEELWGIGLANGTLDYLPYLMSARLAAAQDLPLRMGFANDDLAVPGGPVFNLAGAFVGWAGNAVPVERDMWIGNDYFRVNLRNSDESYAFLYADALETALVPPPGDPLGDPLPWLGLVGIQPMDDETATFLGLAEQGALVVSEVLEDSPAAQAGVQDRDIIVGLNGAKLTRYRPVSVVMQAFERAVRRLVPGDELTLDLLRGTEPLSLTVMLGTGPKPVRAAERAYLPDLGFTVREWVLNDALQRREDPETAQGVVVSFIRPNSPPATAGLQPGDWITEIDGEPIADYAAALTILETVQADETRDEYLLLIARGSETQVLRIRRG